MNIDELTLKQIKEIASLIGSNGQSPHPFKVGDKLYIRTVTYHQTGRVKEVIGKFIMLKDAAWIADSGRWSAAIETGVLSDVEPVTDGCGVNMDSIIDFYPWKHDLPRETK